MAEASGIERMFGLFLTPRVVPYVQMQRIVDYFNNGAHVGVIHPVWVDKEPEPGNPLLFPSKDRLAVINVEIPQNLRDFIRDYLQQKNVIHNGSGLYFIGDDKKDMQAESDDTQPYSSGRLKVKNNNGANDTKLDFWEVPLLDPTSNLGRIVVLMPIPLRKMMLMEDPNRVIDAYNRSEQELRRQLSQYQQFIHETR